MKKMMIIALALGLTLGALAQRHGGGGYHGGGYFVRPNVSFGLGFYSPFGPYGYYSPFGMYGQYGYGYPPYNYGYGRGGRSSQLASKVQDIKIDYADRIYSAKHDTRISHRERRQNVRALKRERDRAVQDEIMNYYKNPSPNTR
jgi:hypothetical protein